MRLALGLLVIGLAGCNQILGVGGVHEATNGADAGGSNNADAPPAADQIHGTSTVTWIHPDLSTTPAPEDLSAYTVRALIRDPSVTGGFRSVPGTGATDGTFSIPATADGDVYVELTRPGSLTHSIYHVDRAVLDAGYPTIGHAGPSVTSKTPVSIAITQMSPWTDLDSFLIGSYGAGTFEPIFPTPPTNLPADGATTDAGSTIDWSLGVVADPGALPRPIDASQGDELRVAHVRTTSVADTAGATAQLTYTVDAASISNVAMTDGAVSNASGALATFEPSAQQSVTIDVSAWAAADATRTSPGVFCERYTNPGATFDLAVGIPDWQLSAPITLPATSREFATVSYAAVFPETWPSLIQCDAQQNAIRQIPGVGMAGFAVHSYVSQPGGRNVTLKPTIAAPTGASFGGVPFATDGQTVKVDGSQPIAIAWTAAPWATQYHIDVRRYVPAGTPPVEVVATIDTTETSADLPLDVITPGSVYVISLWSVKATGGLPSGQLRQTGAFGERTQLLSMPITLE